MGAMAKLPPTRWNMFGATAAWLLSFAAAGCSSASRGSASGEMEFKEIGRERLTAAVSPDSYTLVRVGYEVDGQHEILPVNEPMSAAGVVVKEELAGMLLRLEQASLSTLAAPLSAGGARETKGKARRLLRSYELAVREAWIADLEILEPPEPESNLTILGRVNGQELEIEASIPNLLDYLRELSLGALLRDMERPRRALDWHYVALAGFLGVKGPEGHRGQAPGPPALKRVLLDRLNSAPDPRPLAKALFPRVGAFEEKELSPHAQSERIAFRLLPIVRSAWNGDRAALREILTLFFEYHGELQLFDRALRSLFPPSLNPGMYQKYPDLGEPGVTLLLFKELQARLPEEIHRPGRGWVLDGQ